jgi:phosphate transport system protein
MVGDVAGRSPPPLPVLRLAFTHLLHDTPLADGCRAPRVQRQWHNAPPCKVTTTILRAMRETFHAELDTLIGDLASTTRLTGQMMTNASIALHHADLELAESVIPGKGELKALCDDMDQRCVKLLVLQAPVATDLRMVVAALHMVGDLQRMGNLAQHIAKIALMKHPAVPIPGEIRPVFARMGVLATSLAQDAATSIKSRDPLSAHRLAQDDEEVDALRRRTFRILFAKDWSHGVEPAVDTALIARYYERFADHAVAIARQVSFLATDLPPEQ